MERKFSENGGSILQQVVSRLGLSAALGPDLIQQRAPIPYAPGSLIFLENSPADLLFWVQSGLVKVCSSAPDGSRFVVRLAGAGEILGFVSVDDSAGQRVQAFEAEAFTKCSIVPITREHVRSLLGKANSTATVQVVEEINAFWSKMFAEFVHFLGLSYRERLHSVLNDLAARLGVPEARGILLVPELSHEDFAELIGSSRPMATRLISNMIDEGIIRRDGRRYILLNPGRHSTLLSESSVVISKPPT